jgi:hypothetical protein
MTSAAVTACSLTAFLCEGTGLQVAWVAAGALVDRQLSGHEVTSKQALSCQP